jgi:hypothetical protein
MKTAILFAAALNLAAQVGSNPAPMKALRAEAQSQPTGKSSIEGTVVDSNRPTHTQSGGPTKRHGRTKRRYRYSGPFYVPSVDRGPVHDSSIQR